MSIKGQSDNGQRRPGLSDTAGTAGTDPRAQASPAKVADEPSARCPVVLVLGAGLSRRFGGDKLAARLPDGREVGAATLQVARAGWPQVACVVRPGTRMAELAAEAGVRVIECPEAVDGMGHSLAAGVRATPDAGGWVVMLGDMPHVSSGTVRRVAQAIQDGATVVLPVCQGRRGHPVGLHGRLAGRLAALTGDEGARAVVASLSHEVRMLDVDDIGILADMDRPDDLDASSET